MKSQELSLLRNKPQFSERDAVAMARDGYELTVSAKTLPSERDQNFLFSTVQGERFVFKIANANEERACWRPRIGSCAIWKKNFLCPRVLAAQNNEFISEAVSAGGTRHFVRLLSYLPGKPLATVNRHGAGLMADLGRRIGELTGASRWF